MKKIYISLLIIAAFVSFCFAQEETDSLFNYADNYKNNGQLENARQLYKKIINNSRPDSEHGAKAQFMLGVLFEIEMNYDSAQAEYSKVKEKYPSRSEWKEQSEFSLALCLFKKAFSTADSQQTDLVLEKYLAFIKNYPQSKNMPQALFTIARIYMNKSDWLSSLSYLDNLISFAEVNISGISEKEKKEYKRQVDELKENALLTRAGIYHHELQSWEKALEDYNQLLSINPARRDVELSKALLLIQMNYPQEAREILEKLSAGGGAEGEAAAAYLTQLNTSMGE